MLRKTGEPVNMIDVPAALIQSLMKPGPADLVKSHHKPGPGSALSQAVQLLRLEVLKKEWN